MSLILDTRHPMTHAHIEPDPALASREAALLDRYLAIMETNKTASNFVPNDALVALDMAGDICARIAGSGRTPQISAARLAMALVQNQIEAPMQ